MEDSSTDVGIYYINLASQEDRRDFLEQNIQAHNRLDWPCTRIDAVNKDSAQVMEAKYDSSLRHGEIACFLSHRNAIELSLSAESHALILEDDAMFFQHTQSMIVHAIRSMAEDQWDIMVADMCITGTKDMLDHFDWKNKNKGKMEVRDLQPVWFCGSSAYIVNRHSKNKLLELLDQHGTPTWPFDLLVREWIWKGDLKGHYVFPFPITLSHFAQTSQIQPDNILMRDMLWISFRKLICAASEPDEANQWLNALPDAHWDAEALTLARIIAGLHAKGLVCA
jgi:GR25 family glycosyltransferase involved in LPS biosynthesis